MHYLEGIYQIIPSPYKDFLDTGIINSEDVDNDFLREFLELDPFVVIEASVKKIRDLQGSG